ncbi:MAG: amidase domain-containing protein [Ruminococcus sp.]|jgi:hypothetical protein|nr:amidase domain-containing protein [Ruminococcus sp.]
MAYNREAARSYAEKWANARNPRYYDFEEVGGDCTNFISQCLLAGGAQMNFTPTFGWYYRSANDRAPAWSGVEFLYNFLTTNKGVGPKAVECALSECEIGDVVQINADGPRFSHTMLVTAIPAPGKLLLTTHSYDYYNRPLDSWTYKGVRFLKISV